MNLEILRQVENNLKLLFPKESLIDLKEGKILINGKLNKPRYILTQPKNLRNKRFKNICDIGVVQLLLTPYNLSTQNFCPYAGNCKYVCIGFGGKKEKLQFWAQLKRSLWFLTNREEFLQNLIKEIINFIKNAKKIGLYPVIRLNGYSDIPWENIKIPFKEIEPLLKNYKLGSFRYNEIKTNPKIADFLAQKIKYSLEKNQDRTFSANDDVTIFDIFYDILFYDYTKNPNRNLIPPNYFLTFSYDKGNAQKPNYKVPKHLNVAIIVEKNLKKKLLDFYPELTVDGDLYDCRILDEGKVIANQDKCDFLIEDPPRRKIVLLEFQQRTNHKISIDEVAITSLSEFQNTIAKLGFKLNS